MPRRSGRPLSPASASTPAKSPSSSALAQLPSFAIWFGLFLAVLLAYWPALNGGFLWDDDGHITRPDLRSLAGLGRIWFEIGATQQYYPLLHSAFWLEHQLWGDASLGYHLVNLLQHATAAFLFGLVLRRLFAPNLRPAAWLAATLFALHPVCVESVAWITEQKNTLSAVFYLAAALAYLNFHDARAAPPQLKTQNPKLKTYWTYWLATALFACALLTKSVTATLPAALLVVLWWKHGRIEWRRDVLPLLPWFVLATASGLFTAHFERELIGAQGAAHDLTFIERFLLAGRVVWFYLGKLLWPANLTFIYPRWTIDASVWWQWLFPLVTIAVLALAVYAARTRRPPWSRAVPAALLLFGGTLFPVLGFFNVYPFLFSYVADHFQYLASLPIFALAAAGFTQLASFPALRSPALRSSLLATLVLTLAGLTWSQAGAYRDSLTLYRTTIERNPAASLAHHNLAVALADAGQPAEAIAHFEQALKLRSGYAHARANLGDVLLQLGRPREALPHLEEAVRLQPNYAAAHNTLGATLAALGRSDEARAHYESAIRIQPDLAAAHRNLGLAIATAGRHAEAIPHFERAIALAPHDRDAELSLAIALMATDRFTAAVPHFERAIALSPHSPNAHHTYARALASRGDLDAAIRHLRDAVALAPQRPDLHRDLALALRQAGRLEEAQHHFLQAGASTR
jgi:tetratricopeptide (TPR) repeat protein